MTAPIKIIIVCTSESCPPWGEAGTAVVDPFTVIDGCADDVGVADVEGVTDGDPPKKLNDGSCMPNIVLPPGLVEGVGVGVIVPGAGVTLPAIGVGVIDVPGSGDTVTVGVGDAVSLGVGVTVGVSDGMAVGVAVGVGVAGGATPRYTFATSWPFCFTE